MAACLSPDTTTQPREGWPASHTVGVRRGWHGGPWGQRKRGTEAALHPQASLGFTKNPQDISLCGGYSCGAICCSQSLEDPFVTGSWWRATGRSLWWGSRVNRDQSQLSDQGSLSTAHPLQPVCRHFPQPCPPRMPPRPRTTLDMLARATVRVLLALPRLPDVAPPPGPPGTTGAAL